MIVPPPPPPLLEVLAAATPVAPPPAEIVPPPFRFPVARGVEPVRSKFRGIEHFVFAFALRSGAITVAELRDRKEQIDVGVFFVLAGEQTNSPIHVVCVHELHRAVGLDVDVRGTG